MKKLKSKCNKCILLERKIENGAQKPKLINEDCIERVRKPRKSLSVGVLRMHQWQTMHYQEVAIMFLLL